MDALPDIERRTMAIRHAAWMVRHYERGYRQRSSPMHEQRRAAIRALGLLVREAFNATEDFEPVLVAVVDGLRPRYEEQPF